MEERLITTIRFFVENKDKYFKPEELPSEIKLLFNRTELPDVLGSVLIREGILKQHDRFLSYKATGKAAEMIAPILQKEEKKSIKESMEYDKLSKEIFDLNNKIKDYTFTKRMAILGVCIATAALILELLKWYQEQPVK